jgi:hypothetical protein
VLTLADVKIEATGGKPHSGALHADGKLDIDGKTLLTLTADGKAIDAKGQTVTTIDRDGKVGTKGIVVDEDGSVKAPDGKLVFRLDADGTVTDGDGKTAPFKLTVSDPKARRSIMFAFLVLEAGGTMSSTSGPGCPIVKGSKVSGSPTGCACEDTNAGKKYELTCDNTGAKPCVCKVNGKQTATVPAKKDICDDQGVWAACGFPAHPEEIKPQF